jgi:hypothetical protein
LRFIDPIAAGQATAAPTPPTRLHYATYFDRHYLTRGLALHRSLLRHSPPFQLWVLCLDDETFRVLDRLKLAHVRLIPLAELERADPALLAVKPTRTPVEYYWTCGPALLAYLLGLDPTSETLTYLDADLFFFGDPTPIYDELAGGSISLIEHRWAPPLGPNSRPKGVYNVGMLVFRRTAEALACLSRWREQCLEWCFDRIEPNRFGDQKYLEEWPARYRGVTIVQQKGAGLAPWNVGRYRIGAAQGRVWVDADPLIFYHFNRLRVITDWLYEPCFWARRRQITPTALHQIYVPYVRELQAAAGTLRSVGASVARLEGLRSGESLLQSFGRLVFRRNFLIVTSSFVAMG